jgi:hypothetical protein
MSFIAQLLSWKEKHIFMSRTDYFCNVLDHKPVLSLLRSHVPEGQASFQTAPQMQVFMSEMSIPCLCTFGLFARDHSKNPVDEISAVV